MVNSEFISIYTVYTESDPSRVTIVEGDVLDRAALEGAMRDQDVVYASLVGGLAVQASSHRHRTAR
jgi:putative NADH-flavin reductase